MTMKLSIPDSIAAPAKGTITGWPLIAAGEIASFDYFGGRTIKKEISVPVGDETTVDTLYLRIRADIDVDGAVPSEPCAAGIAGLLKHLTLKFNDRDTTIDITPFALVALAKHDFRRVLDGDYVLGVGSKSYDLIVPIDQRLLHSVLPIQTSLDMRLVKKGILSIMFGDIGDLYGNAGSATIVAGSVQVDLHYRGTRHNTSARGMHMRSLMEHREQVTVNNTNFEAVKLEREVYSGLLLRTYLRSITIQGVANERVTEVLDNEQNLRVKVGSTTLIDAPLALIRASQNDISPFKASLGDRIHLPFFKTGNTFECPPMDTMTGGLTITCGVKASPNSELSILVETIRRPVLA